MKILEKLRTQFMLIVGIVGIIWIILLSIPFLIWLMLLVNIYLDISKQLKTI